MPIRVTVAFERCQSEAQISPAVSEAAAQEFLSARSGGHAAKVERSRHGAWSTAYAFQEDGGDYVIRFSHFREDFDKDRIAARFTSPALPIPRIVEIGEAFGGFYAISDRAVGTSSMSLVKSQVEMPGVVNSFARRVTCADEGPRVGAARDRHDIDRPCPVCLDLQSHGIGSFQRPRAAVPADRVDEEVSLRTAKDLHDEVGPTGVRRPLVAETALDAA